MSAKAKPKDFIKTLQDLEHAANCRSSLMCDRAMWDRPTPAAIVFRMPGEKILAYIDAGLYIYTPKPKTCVFGRKEKTL